MQKKQTSRHILTNSDHLRRNTRGSVDFVKRSTQCQAVPVQAARENSNTIATSARFLPRLIYVRNA